MGGPYPDTPNPCEDCKGELKGEDGRIYTCDNCPVVAETKKKFVLKGIVRQMWGQVMDHQPYRGNVVTEDDKENLGQMEPDRIHKFLSEVPDGSSVTITVEVGGEHPNAKGHVWKLVKPHIYGRVKKEEKWMGYSNLSPPDKQHIKFVIVEYKPKTFVWDVRTKKDNDTIGQVRWYPGWRKYVFVPEHGTVYDAGCMATITKFTQKAMRDRRRSK